MRPFAAAIAVLCVTGCATVALQEFDQRYGKPDPTRYDVAAKPEAGMSYRRDVQPILERRCVVCHACYDAPCQLKLTAWEGIARGASKTPVYDAARLREAPTTRLFLDAQLPSQWWETRLLAGAQRPHRHARDQSRRERALSQPALKREHPLPTTPVLSQGIRLLARPRGDLPAHRRVREPREQAAARRNALRPARARPSASSRRSSAGSRRARLTKAIRRCHPRCRSRFARGRRFSTANRTRSG